MLQDTQGSSTINWLNVLPPELIKHSIYPFVEVSGIPSLFCTCKKLRLLLDDNECWKEKFFHIFPKWQIPMLEDKHFESVWKSCLLGKKSIAKESMKHISMKDISYKKLVRSVFVDGRMSGFRFYNCGTHKDIAPSYTYILKTDCNAYDSMRSIYDYYHTYNLENIPLWEHSALEKAKRNNIEFFTGKCYAITAPDSDNYIYFGISIGLYISIFQIWHPSIDLITNVLGRKIVYKAHKKREGQGKEELWTQEKNYKMKMRGENAANVDLVVHGVWCDSINRSGFCSSENVNQNQSKTLNVIDINNKLLKLNYETFDFEHEKNSLSILQKQDWKLTMDGGLIFTLKFKKNDKYVEGTFEFESTKRGKVTGNILDCYLSVNLIDERTDGVLQHYCMAVCEWTPTLDPKRVLIVTTQGLQGEAILSII